MTRLILSVLIMLSAVPLAWSAEPEHDDETKRLEAALERFQQALNREQQQQGDRVQKRVEAVEGPSENGDGSGALLIQRKLPAEPVILKRPPTLEPVPESTDATSTLIGYVRPDAQTQSGGYKYPVMPPMPAQLDGYEGVDPEVLLRLQSQIGFFEQADGTIGAPHGTFDMMMHHAWLSVYQPDFDGPKLYPAQKDFTPDKIKKVIGIMRNKQAWKHLSRSDWLTLTEQMVRHAENQHFSEYYHTALKTPFQKIYDSYQSPRSRYSIATSLRSLDIVDKTMLEQTTKTPMSELTPTSPLEAGVFKAFEKYQAEAKGVLKRLPEVDFVDLAEQWETYWENLNGSDSPR